MGLFDSGLSQYELLQLLRSTGAGGPIDSAGEAAAGTPPFVTEPWAPSPFSPVQGFGNDAIMAPESPPLTPPQPPNLNEPRPPTPQVPALDLGDNSTPAPVTQLAGGGALLPTAPMPGMTDNVVSRADAMHGPGPNFAGVADATPAGGVPAPEAIARNLAARGVMPPKQDAVAALPSWVDARAAGDVGGALTGQSSVPLPRPKPGTSGSTDMSARSVTPGAPMDIKTSSQKDAEAAVKAQGPAKTTDERLGKFAAALAGVKAPAPPALQHLSTPALPRNTTAIKGGDVIALLQSLAQGKPAGGLELPATLGAALRR